MNVPMTLSGPLVATVSALCEPWVFHRFHGPTLPANSAVGVATKASIFIEVPQDLFKLTPADENAGGLHFVGAEVASVTFILTETSLQYKNFSIFTE